MGFCARTMEEINQDSAYDIALEYLAILELEIGEPLALCASETIEKPFGWVFFYNSKAFIESKAFRKRLMGNTPFVVSRVDGTIRELGTAKPIDDYIEVLEQEVSE